MEVKYKNKKYKIQAVNPADFLAIQGVPFGLFQTKAQQQTVWESIDKRVKTESELIENHKKSQDVMRLVILAGVTSKISIERVLKDDQLCLFLYSCIIAQSVKAIDQCLEVDHSNATSIDVVATRYSQRPSDLIIPDGTATEKLSFDTFICSVGIGNDLKAIKAQQRKLKNGN